MLESSRVFEWRSARPGGVLRSAGTLGFRAAHLSNAGGPLGQYWRTRGRSAPVADDRCVLRVRLRSLRGITEFSDHQANRREMDESQSIPNPILKILGQATIAIEPGERAFDDPTFG